MRFFSERRLLHFGPAGPEMGGDGTESAETQDAAPEAAEQENIDVENPEQLVEDELKKANTEVEGNKGNVVARLRAMAKKFDQMAKNDPENLQTLQRDAASLRSSADAAENAQQLTDGDEKSPDNSSQNRQEVIDHLRSQAKKLKGNAAKILNEMADELEANRKKEGASETLTEDELADIASNHLCKQFNIPAEKSKDVKAMLMKTEFRQALGSAAIELTAMEPPLSDKEAKEWLIKKVKSTSPAIEKDIQEFIELIDKGKETTEGKEDAKDKPKSFAEVLKEFFAAIEELLKELGIELGLTKPDEKVSNADQSKTTYEDFAKSDKEIPVSEAQNNLTGQKEKIGRNITSAENDLLNAKQDATEAGENVKKVEKQIAALDPNDKEGRAKLDTQLKEAKDVQKAADEAVVKAQAQVDDLKATLKDVEDALALYNKVATTEGGSTMVNPSKTQEYIDKGFTKTPAKPKKPKKKSKLQTKPDIKADEGNSPDEKVPEKTDVPSEKKEEPAGKSEKITPDKKKLDTWLKKQKQAANSGTGMRGLDTSIDARSSDISVVSNKIGSIAEVKVKGANGVIESWLIGKKVGRIGMHKKNNPLVSVLVPKGTKMTADNIKKYTSNAEKNYASEVADEAKMGEGFEISDGGPIGYISLADKSDPLTNQDYATTSDNMAMVLGSRYDMRVAPGSDIDGSKTNPVTALRATIQQQYKEGIRNFYINVFAHGSEGATWFGKNRVEPGQLSQMFKSEFPDCKITLNTLACYGGGIGDEMKEFVDNKDAKNQRVTAFSQTKGDVVNFGAGLGGDYSTRYNAKLAVALTQGIDGRPGKKLTYGEAHLQADRLAKFGQMTDAEVHSSQPGAKSTHTADLNDMGQFEGMA